MRSDCTSILKLNENSFPLYLPLIKRQRRGLGPLDKSVLGGSTGTAVCRPMAADEGEDCFLSENFGENCC